MKISTLKRRLIANSQNVVLVAFLVIVACSNRCPTFLKSNPEQLRASTGPRPSPYRATYKMVPYDL